MATEARSTGLRGRRRRARVANTLLWCYAGTFYLYLYGPMAVVAVLSVNDSEIVGLPFKGFTLEWYRVAFRSPELIDSLLKSLALGAATAGR